MNFRNHKWTMFKINNDKIKPQLAKASVTIGEPRVFRSQSQVYLF